MCVPTVFGLIMSLRAISVSGASDDEVSDAILEGLSNLPVTVTHTVSCDLLLNGMPGGPAFRETITITVPAPDLAIAKTGPAQVTEGDNITYTLTARNLGPTTATGVTVSDPVPANSTFVSASAGCAHAAGLVTCTAGTMAPGATQVFTIVVQAGSGNTVVNTATIDGDQDDPNLANNVATVTTRINHNPVCTAATTGLGLLWPPNHKLVSGQIAGVTDVDGDPITLVITGIMQDEPVNGEADGNTSPDATIGAGGAFQVRAERSGQGDGRVYRVAFTATDGQGGDCSGVGRIGVPHDQGGQSIPIDSAPPSYNSLLP